MKRLFHLIVFQCLFMQSFSQINLVPNPSFEEYINCPGLEDSSRFINYMPPWFSPNWGTPDFFNRCDNYTINSNIGVPYNCGGSYQQAHTGNGYGGFEWCQSDDCEYFSIKLTSSLQEGKKYCVEFYVNLLNTSYWGYDRIGAYLSKDSLCVPTYGYLHFIPQVENPAGNVILDTLNWTLISGSFIAQGGEQYITIGNFRPDSLVQLVINDTVIGNWPYYNLDDVSVTLCDDTVGIKNYTVKSNTVGLIYPNPVTDNASIDYTITSAAKAELKVFSIAGKEIADYELNTKENHFTFSTGQFKSGIYFYQVIANGVQVSYNKFIIIK